MTTVYIHTFLHIYSMWSSPLMYKDTLTTQHHPPLSGLSGTWPAVGARGSVKPAWSPGCADARVRRLWLGCCTWQGLVLHHVFHSRFAPSCGYRRKRLWLRRRVLWLELSCSHSDRFEFMIRLRHALRWIQQGLFWDRWVAHLYWNHAQLSLISAV